MFDDKDEKLIRRMIVFVFLAGVFTVLGLAGWFLNVSEFK